MFRFYKVFFSSMFRHILRNGNRLAVSSTKTTQRLYSSASPNQNNKPSVPAMLAVASMGFAAYYTLVQNREGKSKYLFPWDNMQH